MRRLSPKLLLLLFTGCNLVEGGAEPRWWEDDAAVLDDTCEANGTGYAPEAEVVSTVVFVASGRELELSCGTAFVQGYFQYWRPDVALRPDPSEEYLVSVTASAPFIVWKTEMSDHYCPVDQACVVGELVGDDYHAEFTVTPETRYDDATAVVGIGTIEDVDYGGATIRIAKVAGYGAGGAAGESGAP